MTSPTGATWRSRGSSGPGASIPGCRRRRRSCSAAPEVQEPPSTRSLRARARPAGSNAKGTERLSGFQKVDVGLHVEMKVRQGCVPRVADQAQRVALPNPVAFADPERPLPEVRQDDEEARVELDDDDVPLRVVGHEVSCLRHPPCRCAPRRPCHPRVTGAAAPSYGKPRCRSRRWTCARSPAG